MNRTTMIAAVAWSLGLGACAMDSNPGPTALDGSYAISWACLCPADAVNPRRTATEITVSGGGTVIEWSDGAVDQGVNLKDRCVDVTADGDGAAYRLCLTPDGIAGELVWTPGQTWRLTGVRL
jgi:hypothetical protein